MKVVLIGFVKLWNGIKAGQRASMDYVVLVFLTYNIPYNCMSVICNRNSFCQKKNAGPTIKVTKPNVKCDLSTYPHPVMLADSDLMLLNRMYECKDR